MSTSALSGGDIARGLGGESRVKWPLRRSSDLFDLRYGKALVASSRRPGGVPVFGTNGQTGSHDTPLFAGPGVIVGRKSAGHLGVHWTDMDYWVIDTAYSLVPNADVNLRFAYYLVNFVGLNHLKHGTSNPSLTREAFGAQYFPVPPIEEQRAIADTLDALDEKIESNRRAMAVANSLAMAILATGVATVRVGDVAELIKGLSYKGAGLDGGTAAGALPLLNLANFTAGGSLKRGGLKYYTGEFKPKHRVAGWDLLVANTDLTQSREILGRGFLVPPAFEGALHTHHTSKVNFFDHPELAPVLWAQLQSPGFRERAKGFATGTTVTALPTESLLDFELAIPDDLEHALERARVLVECAWGLEAESVQLGRVRDALLPELLSGRVRVSKVVA